MTERLPQNDLPLNQQAKRLLKRTDDGEYDPDSLYVLQLFLWGLLHDDLAMPKEQADRLESHLGNLLHWPPAKLLKLLYPGGRQGQKELADHLESLDDPLEAALELAVDFHLKLPELVEGYPPQPLSAAV